MSIESFLFFFNLFFTLTWQHYQRSALVWTRPKMWGTYQESICHYPVSFFPFCIAENKPLCSFYNIREKNSMLRVTTSEKKTDNETVNLVSLSLCVNKIAVFWKNMSHQHVLQCNASHPSRPFLMLLMCTLTTENWVRIGEEESEVQYETWRQSVYKNAVFLSLIMCGYNMCASVSNTVNDEFSGRRIFRTCPIIRTPSRHRHVRHRVNV